MNIEAPIFRTFPLSRLFRANGKRHEDKIPRSKVLDFGKHRERIPLPCPVAQVLPQTVFNPHRLNGFSVGRLNWNLGRPGPFSQLPDCAVR